MRIIDNLNRNSTNSYSYNSPSFGAVYTKSSVKLLKELIPEIIHEHGFEFGQRAINNLLQTGKRKDNLILKLIDIDKLGVDYLEVRAKHLSEKVNSFNKIDTPIESVGLKESQDFEHLTDFINSDSFVSKANEVLNAEDKLPHFQKVKNFLREKRQDLSQKILDKVDSISEEIFCIDESNSQSECTVFENLKNFVKTLFVKEKNPYRYNDKQKKEAKILAEMIDNLPILNKYNQKVH